MALSRIKPEGKTDQELVELALQNPDDYYYLIKKYEKKIGQYINRLSCLTPEDSEDLLQEIFLAAYKNLNSYNPKLKFSSWLYRIAHNKTISFWRKNQKNAPISLDLNQDFLAFLADEKKDAVQKLIQKNNQEEIKKAVQELKEKYREVIILKFFEEKSYQEIADILRKPSGTIATLLNRAKKQLRKKLNGKI